MLAEATNTVKLRLLTAELQSGDISPIVPASFDNACKVLLLGSFVVLPQSPFGDLGLVHLHTGEHQRGSSFGPHLASVSVHIMDLPSLKIELGRQHLHDSLQLHILLYL